MTAGHMRVVCQQHQGNSAGHFAQGAYWSSGVDVYKRQRLVLMTAGGRQHSSPELAAWLQTQLEQVGTLAFLIGGPVGFDPATIAAAHEQLALSRLTLPHELARVVLLEQLYRAFTIIHGEPYHK